MNYTYIITLHPSLVKRCRRGAPAADSVRFQLRHYWSRRLKTTHEGGGQCPLPTSAFVKLNRRDNPRCRQCLLPTSAQLKLNSKDNPRGWSLTWFARHFTDSVRFQRRRYWSWIVKTTHEGGWQCPLPTSANLQLYKIFRIFWSVTPAVLFYNWFPKKIYLFSSLFSLHFSLRVSLIPHFQNWKKDPQNGCLR